MGKLKAFYIELENPEEVYFSGQVVNGKLFVELGAEMKMRGIYQLAIIHVHVYHM